MCGILGVISLNKDISCNVLEMLKPLQSRGPDGAKLKEIEPQRVYFGHTRLAIIDLTAAGDQPMTNEDGTLWLTFNGEIYNFLSLKSELIKKGHHFKSHSDGEVILHGYEEWGISCLDRLNGIFAFGIWDTKSKKLFLARDHVGVKPLYYCEIGQSLMFASQPKSLIQMPGFNRSVNIGSFADYLTYGYVPFKQSIFTGINKVPAAHYLLWENGVTKIERYWKLRYDPVISNFDEAVSAVRSQVEKSVRAQTMSDVPIGVFLSGGIDSSAVTAIANAQLPGRLASFTLGFDVAWKDERTYARKVSKHLSTTHHERVLDQSTVGNLLAIFSDIYDEPFFDSSGLATYYVADLAREKGIKVILAGDGGDELFAGYTRYYKEENSPLMQIPILNRFVNRPGLVKKFEQPLSTSEYFKKVGFLDASSRRELLGCQDQNDLSYFNAFYQASYPSVTGMQYLDFNTYLVEDILTKVDRASMYCGVEARVPLLDKELVELAFQIREDLHYQRGEKKAVFKSSVKHLLPGTILSNRKKGFSVPMSVWLKQGLQGQFDQFVLNGSLVQRNIISHKVATKLMGTGLQHYVWLLTAAELWARRWLEGLPVSDIRSLFK